LSINRGDIIGHAQLACQGRVSPKWVRWVSLLEVPLVYSNILAVAQTAQNRDPLQSEKTRHLITQQIIMDNRLLANNSKVRDCMVQLTNTYESVSVDARMC